MHPHDLLNGVTDRAGVAERFDPLLKAVRQAGTAIEAVQRGRRPGDDADLDAKADGSPVTTADIASHEILEAALRRQWPDVPVVSEESWTGGPVPDACWVVDPLDGTKEFLKQNGEYVINVGNLVGGRPLAGFVHVPAQQVTYVGVVEVGAWRVGPDGTWQAIHVDAAPASPLRVVGSRSHTNPRTQAFIDALRDQVDEVTSVPMGSALKIVLIAEGKADVYPRLGPTMWWDTVAPHAVVLAAGGHLVTLDGAERRYEGEDALNPDFVVYGGSATGNLVQEAMNDMATRTT